MKYQWQQQFHKTVHDVTKEVVGGMHIRVTKKKQTPYWTFDINRSEIHFRWLLKHRTQKTRNDYVHVRNHVNTVVRAAKVQAWKRLG